MSIRRLEPTIFFILISPFSGFVVESSGDKIGVTLGFVSSDLEIPGGDNGINTRKEIEHCQWLAGKLDFFAVYDIK